MDIHTKDNDDFTLGDGLAILAVITIFVGSGYCIGNTVGYDNGTHQFIPVASSTVAYPPYQVPANDPDLATLQAIVDRLNAIDSGKTFWWTCKVHNVIDSDAPYGYLAFTTESVQFASTTGTYEVPNPSRYSNCSRVSDDRVEQALNQ